MNNNAMIDMIIIATLHIIFLALGVNLSYQFFIGEIVGAIIIILIKLYVNRDLNEK